MKIYPKSHLLFLLAMLSFPPWARAQGTAFAYQGRLEDGGLPANGNYDFVFTVHDAAADGNILGQPVRLDAVTVSAGQFVVPLDYGAGVFTGAPRWLQIAVRKSGNAEAHTILAPRQTLLPTPYALHAGTASRVPDGTVAAGQLNTGGVAPAAGQLLSFNGGNLLWRDPAIVPPSVFSLNGTSAYYDAGNVGIGTPAPTAGYRLEVNGATLLRPGNGTVQFGSPNAELGMSILPTLGDGNSRADLRFDGSVLKLVASAGRVPPSAANGIAITTAGNVGVGKANPGAKLDVLSAGSTAIVGKSTASSGAGVYGESDQFNGVRGLAHNANHGGVVGVHDGGGIAVYGTGAIGVQGDGTSVGVYGRSASGAAVHAEGNATQARDKGGFVKAMIFVAANGTISRCYNGQTGSSGNGCGFSIDDLSGGFGTLYEIKFGFRVDDRFVSVITGQAEEDLRPGVRYRGETTASVTYGYRPTFIGEAVPNSIFVLMSLPAAPFGFYRASFTVIVY